ncbi:molybdate ABC transporter substrate-binding protein [Propioniciclava coleopterorum]|uniref:molybdate ABC transporter substrate-binding protein n=1 Tax=Propioniciclava coleopterorum TaxID=2714937 RepID=UPI001FEC312B|nr:molybdate ABC transporter substrate-binding protein [Propioniciclava coleopterorum]
MRLRIRRVGAVLASLAVLGGCAASPAVPSATPTGTGPAAVSGEITVFAAASLKGAFSDISAEFVKKHPEAKVTFSFDGSNSLVDQLDGGARADVLATADQPNMDRAVAAELVGPPQPFATNVLTVVTPPDNPGRITGFDASLDGKRLVICAPAVPCGNATAKLAQASGLTLKPVSEESKVTDVLGKVTSGEADAGLVYTTDAAGAGAKVKAFPIANADVARNDYPIAVVTGAGNAAGGEAFSAYVRSADGRAVLATYGFGEP